jgi:dipeptidyl aminopeptidase/acylaminoacyl peptidase
MTSVMRSHRSSVTIGVLVVAIMTLGLGCSEDGSDDASGAAPASTSTSTPTTLTFYRPPTVLADGAPGDVLSAEPIALDASLPGTGQKITYVSTTPSGDLVPVTGVLIQPLTPAPSGGYPVVSWAHGTTGLGDQCAPSLVVPFELEGAGDLLRSGFAIAATDYEGMGTPDEIHPYVVGEAEGNNVLDAARAARSIGGGPVTVAWGWSQGGHAALWAAMLARSYAPDLDFRGAAAHAPVTDLRSFLTPGVTDPSLFALTAEAILAWAEVYEETELTDVVVVADAEKARLAQQACSDDLTDNIPRPLDEIFRSDPDNSEVWQTALAVNSADASRIRTPVLLTHGDADPYIAVASTDAFHQALCANHETTVFLRDPAWGHVGAYVDPMPEVVAWITARINGDPAASDC